MDSYFIGVALSELAFLGMFSRYDYGDSLPARLVVYVLALLVWAPMRWFSRRAQDKGTAKPPVSLGPLPPLDRAIGVLLPDNVTVYYRPAPLWQRLRAFWCDLFRIACLAGVLGAVTMGALSALPPRGTQALFCTLGPVTLALVALGYFSLHEGLADGQTPGKKGLGLRVIHESGRALTTGEALVRSTLVCAGLLPPITALDLALMLAWPTRQHLGDLAVGSVVVVDPS